MNNEPKTQPESGLALRDPRGTSLALDPAASALSVQQVLGQLQLIQQVMSATMKEGEHFGKIPGCGDKPTLLKPGAEKLCLTFRLAPAYQVEEKQLDRAHREYRVLCTLSSITTGAFVGQGLGTASSMESKWRFRAGAAEPVQPERAVPRAYWDLRQEDPAKAQELIGGKGFSTRKVEGKGWLICKGGEKVENDNPADVFNTVLKMGKKRALVDAVLTATAASDIFSQDLEDIAANLASAPAATSVDDHPTQPARAARQSPPAKRARPARGQAEQDDADAAAAGVDVRGEGTAPAPSKPVLRATLEELHQVFSEARIHFGKNRGLTLSELTPNQIHWYETEWMPKREKANPTQDDKALFAALRAFRQWREMRAERSKSDEGHAAHDGDGDGAREPEDDGSDPKTARIHFGRHRGETLGALSPESLGWFLDDWLPGKERDLAQCSEADKALMFALRKLAPLEKGAQTPLDGTPAKLDTDRWRNFTIETPGPMNGRKLGDVLGNNPLVKLAALQRHFAEKKPRTDAEKRLSLMVAAGFLEMEAAQPKTKELLRLMGEFHVAKEQLAGLMEGARVPAISFDAITEAEAENIVAIWSQLIDVRDGKAGGGES